MRRAALIAMSAFLALTFSGTVAAAQEIDVNSGNSYLPMAKTALCINDDERTPQDRYDAGLTAMVFARGALEMHSTLVKAGAVPLTYCLPAGTGTTQVLRIFVKYAEEHPEHLQLRPTALILVSLGEAFPCQQ